MVKDNEMFKIQKYTTVNDTKTQQKYVQKAAYTNQA